ncbi:hypothetical protein A3D80_01095 [Candidatus Roizmanbacteria bacterium RIFCSPHIGHO2_02_FULL_40_13b]|uniref:Nudix hydrolase domain-containing protein n=1 Tax=Candidatus Roizmanbacteria bacterium RIFCSPHIGHO2_01_FULL_39_24 TaxID=1802032 RepID=A0A1F7GMN8_9BACT|nr:MAG: hypothetical protein A2799_02750 [Candidatus Roizmanbacteria bacterium RIFCSPHIGHO2_01_FULL_39_24]OGK26292.1 MAG: hypothetical protein A3D80_01095 [Candidatus Roizmanbacteria bacterium RIFCSPHIGHO2_02_FULL_40_13b]OGK49355.1 MAG: hypothetical protein A3A56_03725 [Candidatus Roizmanbacteria bacterium RIFCSPLOWO2_01_FULL_40_32]
MITCTFEDGGIGRKRHVTINAILVKDNKVLLGKRGTYNGNPMLEYGKWGLIGGFVERDENLEEALKREIKEETGCDATSFTLFHIKDNPDRPHEDRQNIEFVFIVQTSDDFTEGNEEVRKLEWFAFDQVPPKEEMAFDHGDDLVLYKKYLSSKFPLPFVGKNSS